MTHLRQIMLEELRRRNFAKTTIRSYLHGVEHFSRYFHRPPDQLGPEDIRKYQAMLFTELKFSPNTVILRLASGSCVAKCRCPTQNSCMWHPSHPHRDLQHEM